MILEIFHQIKFFPFGFSSVSITLLFINFVHRVYGPSRDVSFCTESKTKVDSDGYTNFDEMADKDHECEQVGANDTKSQDEQNSCSQILSSGSCSSCSVEQENKGCIGSPDDAEEVNKGAGPDLTEDVQESCSETSRSEDCARCTEGEEPKKLSDDLKELKIADESEDVQRCSLEKEEFNDGSDREKTEENAVDQATENQQRDGSMDIGAGEDRQELPGEESTEKTVSDTWTPPNCNTSPKSELNESQAAGACCQANSIKDKENDGRNKRDSQSKEIDMDSKSENVEEVKEEHYGYQLKPKQDNQKQHDGTGGGGHSKKGKKKKKTTWKKLDLQQEETIPESQYTGFHSQRNFMQTKKHNDGENQRFQNRGGERDSKHKNFGVGREENKHRSVPGNQSQHDGNRNKWPSLCSESSTEGKEHNDGGNHRNFHSRESGKDSGNHAANAECIEMSEVRGNHGNQRQYGSSERHSTEARKSTEDERYGNEENQWDVHHRESDRKPADEGNWKEVTQKQKRKPGIQRQYGGSGDDRHSSNSRKNKRKDNENNSDFQGEKNSENDSSWERKKKKGGGERRHHFYPDEREKYEYFWKSHSIFSQWYLSDFEVDGIKFNCAEKYMMYQKAVLMEDYEIANYILDLDDPREMKKQGRYVRDFDQKLWDDNCMDIVEAGNFAKFSQNEKLKQKLLNTYPKTLVEASPLDSIWGIGLTADDRRAWNEKTWKGTNLLGKVLTKVRDRLMGSFLDTVKPEETMKGASN